MRHHCTVIISLCFSLLLFAANPVQAHEDAESAVSTARQFLAQLDQGDYSQAWEATAPILRALENRQDWLNRCRVIREAYGPLVGRQLLHTEARTRYAFSPDGDYVIVLFESRFLNKSRTKETVVMMKQPDGLWLVRSYTIS